MAHLHPRQPRSDCSPAERRVFSSLARLPDSWRVFHSVAWQSLRNGAPGDGEADFVLAHPEHGLIVLEVKGGGIDVQAGQWFSTDGNGKQYAIKDPFVQATDSKHSLTAYLRNARPAVGAIPAGHCAAFPNLRDPRSLGPVTPAELILDRGDLERIEPGLRRVSEHWRLRARVSDDDLDALTNLLAPTVAFRPLIADQVADAKVRLRDLTGEQMGVLDSLRRNRRAIIHGEAGTGKTVLAVERARRLRQDGFRVLLTCFNEPLGQRLATEFAGDAGMTVSHFHGVCRTLAERAGLDVRTGDVLSRWYDEELPALLMTAADRLGFKVDAIVVDEGQDFAPGWWTALQLLLEDPDKGPLYVFADAQQAIYREDWEPPFDEPAFDLSVNCRNTLPIARRVSAVLDRRPSTLGAGGPQPEFLEAATPEEVEDQLRGVLHRLLHLEGLRREQIVVLSDRRLFVDGLIGKEFAGTRLVRPGEEGIVAETIHRFKGLEADAAVVILKEISKARERSLAYIGMSRAVGHLVVIGNRDVRQALKWFGKPA